MKNKINVFSITAKDLQKGKYKKLLPEYYELNSVIENSPWHLNQSVFNHMVAVFKGLEKVLGFSFIKGEIKKEVLKHLQTKVKKHSRKELLIIATLLHDIAKKETIIEEQSGIKRCPAHEIIGSNMVKKFSSRFDLSNNETKIVEKIVHYHGFTNDILTLALSKNRISRYCSIFREIVGDIYIELFLLMYADILGSDLEKSNKQEFDKRLELITNFLGKNR